jgi:hypothetical protein
MKVQELKGMADEMEMWATKTEGHLRSMLGRNADELRSLVHAVNLELLPPSDPDQAELPPDWVTDAEMAAPGGEGAPLDPEP